MVCQAIKPLLDQAPPDLFSDDPEELVALAALGLALPRHGQADPPRRRPAADRQRRRLPRRLLRVGHRQGLPGLVQHHRHQGRAVLAGLRARAAVPHPRRARRRVRGVGVPQEGNGGFTQVLARAAASFGAEIRLESPVDRGHHQGRPGDRRRARRRHRVPRRHGRRARSTRAGRSSSSSTRASCRPTSSRPSSGSASRARRRRSTSRSTGCRSTRPCPAATDQYRGFTNIGPSMEYLERAFDDGKYGWYSSRPYIDCAIQSTIDPDMAPPGKHVMSLLRPVHAVPPARERLGHREGEPGRHRPAHARVVLPGLRRPRPPARGA